MRRALSTVLVLVITALLGCFVRPFLTCNRVMASPEEKLMINDDRIRGKTLRWTWTEGIVKDTTHEHVFGTNGTVVWRVLNGPQEGHSAEEKEYSAAKVADDVSVVSYLAASGNTLTAVLNFRDKTMVGYASGAKNWYPMRGTFEVVK